MIDKDVLAKCMPQASHSAIETYTDYIILTAAEFDLNSPERIAAFISQIGHESGDLRHVVENLNYGVDGLLKTFRKYFNSDNVSQYARKPELIANRVYANRMGNGDEDSGDGWKFRGRGLIQITGRENYLECGQDINHDLIEDPSYLETPEGACRSAGWFWGYRKLNVFADVGNIKEVSFRVNGGFNGLQDRIDRYHRALGILNG